MVAGSLPDRHSGKSAARNGFLAALFCIFLFLVFFFYNFQTVVVSGNSMAPVLHNRERILVCNALWLVGPVQHNDIVVVRMGGPGDYIVKQVYAVGGETVHDVTLSPYNWDYYSQGFYKVPKDAVYLIGVNLDESEDSRSFGPIPLSDVIGKVVRRP